MLVVSPVVLVALALPPNMPCLRVLEAPLAMDLCPIAMLPMVCKLVLDLTLVLPRLPFLVQAATLDLALPKVDLALAGSPTEVVEPLRAATPTHLGSLVPVSEVSASTMTIDETEPLDMARLA